MTAKQIQSGKTTAMDAALDDLAKDGLDDLPF